MRGRNAAQLGCQPGGRLPRSRRAEGVWTKAAVLVGLSLCLRAAAAFQLHETHCYSCASEDYRLVWELAHKQRRPISAYLNAPKKFSTLCSNPDAFRTEAALTRCNFTCLSILEPTVAGGIYQDHMFMRGCAESLFKVPSSFQVLHELGLLALGPMDAPRCAKVEIKDLYGSSKLPEFLDVCACKWDQCNTHPLLPARVNGALAALPALLHALPALLHALPALLPALTALLPSLLL